jgi:PAS domain S-box-containing protein
VKSGLRQFFSLPQNFATLAGVALLIAVVAGAHISLRSVNELLRAERLSLRVLADIESLQDALREIEVVQSDYLSSAEPALLARFETLREKVRSHLAELGQRVENPDQRIALPAINSAMREWLALTEEKMRQRRADAGAAAQPALSPGQLTLAQSARGLIDEFERRHRRAIADRASGASDDAGFMGRAIFVGFVMAALLLGWALWAAQRNERSRRAAEAALQVRSRELRLLVDAMPAMITYVGADRRFLFHNRRYSEWIGVPSARIDGRPVSEVVSRETYAVIAPHLERALAGEEVSYERQEARPDGEMRDLAVAYVPHRGTGGDVLGCYALVTDVTEVKDLGRFKGEFASRMSHEVRTPMAAISGSLGLLAGGGGGPLPDAASRLVAIARENCERLVRLVDDLTDIERFEAGEVTLHLRDEDPARLLSAAVSAAAPAAGKRGVRIEAGATPPGIHVRADGERANQVLGHLLANAVQFSPDGAVVHASLETRGGVVRFSVRDQGPGVSADFVPRLFERFAQEAAAARGSTGRFGLGLAISKTLVERMGGRIGYEPAAGGGSVFWFELPQGGRRKARELRRILYIEDDESIRKVGTMALETVGGFQVTGCASGAEGIARAPSAAADLILLDVMMPEMDGPQTLARLRSIPQTAATPVVFLTATVQPAEIARLRALGAADVLGKPFEPMNLPQKLREIWARCTA